MKQSLVVPDGWKIVVGDSATGMFRYGVRLSGPGNTRHYLPAHTKWGARRAIKRLRDLAWASIREEF